MLSDHEIAQRARHQVTQFPDLARPILHKDEETGEVILGGEDSPRVDALRAELEQKWRERLAALYNSPE